MIRQPIELIQIGAGSVGLKRIAAISTIEAVHIAAVVDPQIDRACAALQRLVPDALLAQSVSEVLTLVRPDAAVISTPPSEHAPLAEQLFAHKIDVLCEKPCGRHFHDTLRCVEAAEHSGRMLKLASNYLQFPSIRCAFERLHRGQIGELRKLSIAIGHNRGLVLPAWFRTFAISGGGCLRDLGSHGLLIALKALNQTEAFNTVRCITELHTATAPIEMRAYAHVIGQNDVNIEIRTSWRTPTPFELEIVFEGEQGTLIVQSPDILISSIDSLAQPVASDPLESWVRDSEVFVASIRTGATPDAIGHHAAACAKTIDALYARAEQRLIA